MEANALNNQHNKNLRAPPKTRDFNALFQFIWNHGLGNQLDNNGDPILWTDERLEIAFEAAGKTIDKRTVQNWLSGQNRPSRRNLHLLARIVSSGDNDLRQEWADALITASKGKTKNSKAPLAGKPVGAKTDNVPQIKTSKTKPFLSSF